MTEPSRPQIPRFACCGALTPMPGDPEQHAETCPYASDHPYAPYRLRLPRLDCCGALAPLLVGTPARHAPGCERLTPAAVLAGLASKVVEAAQSSRGDFALVDGDDGQDGAEDPEMALAIQKGISADLRVESRARGEKLARAEAALARVRDLAEQWITAGAPPLGTSISRWWDRRLAELIVAVTIPAAVATLVDGDEGDGPSPFLPRIRQAWVATDDAGQRLAELNADPERFRRIIDGQLRPNTLDLALIATACRVTVDWLISGTEPRLPDRTTADNPAALDGPAGTTPAADAEDAPEPGRKRILIDAPGQHVIAAARHLDHTEGPVQVGTTVTTSARSAINAVLGYIAKAHNSAAAEDAPERVEVMQLLRLIAVWVRQVDRGLGADADDLVALLAQAGFRLPDLDAEVGR